MAKNGKRPKTGGPSSPPSKEVRFENLPKLPDPPIHVAKPKLPNLALAKLSPLSVAFRWIRPSWRSYIQYVELAARKGNTAMARFLDCYTAILPRDKASIWPEQVCGLADVTPDELVGAVCQQIWASKAAESSMVSAIAHPEVLMRTIQLAKQEENFRDRELFFRMSGSLPDRKGASINIYNQAAGQVTEAPLPSVVGKAKLKTFDEEVIDMSRDLETPDPPFLVRPDVPSESD